MRLLVFVFMTICLPLTASTAKQVLSVCYFDESKVQFEMPKVPNFLGGQGAESIEKGYMIFYERKMFDVLSLLSFYGGGNVVFEKGYMIFYERKMFDVLSLLSFYGGGNVGRYHKSSDTLYSASLALATRFWVMHFVLLHPYIEASFFGPTILSKNEFDLSNLKSNFIFQNTLSVGAEVGAGSGFCVELKAVKYFYGNLSHPEQGGLRVPLLLSLGFLF